MARLSADQIIIETLKSEGVKYWFGSIGEEQHSLLDRMYLDGNVKLFDTRHENSGVLVATGYSQATGGASVCSGTVGSGVANMFNGMYSAFRAHVPVVAIVCKTAPGYWERGVTKGFDQSGVFSHITKWVVDVDDIAQLADALQRAFRMATTPPTGPVMVCVNRRLLADVGGPLIEVDVPRKVNYKPSSPITYASENDVCKVIDRLLTCESPAILTDDRLFWNNAEPELVELAERLAIPICTTGVNFGPILPYDHPLWFGLIRSAHYPTPLGKKLLDRSDLWLAVDCDFALSSVGHFLPSPLTHIVQIDNAPEYIARVYPVDLGIMGHSKGVLRQILDKLPKTIGRETRERRLKKARADKAEWLAAVDAEVQATRNKVPISPLHLIRTLSDVLPEDGYIVVRGGNIAFFFQTLGMFQARTPRHIFMRGEDSSLGQAVGKAMGVKLANPRSTVVALVGDGELYYGNLSELETLKRHQLPITIVVSNNGSLGTDRSIQTECYERRYVGTNIDNPDFVMLAHSFGLHGEKVTEPKDLGRALVRAIDSGKSAIVDVVTDPDDVPAAWRNRVRLTRVK